MQADEPSTSEPVSLESKENSALMDQAESADQHTIATFMELPLELRRHIYSYPVPNVKTTTESRNQALGHELRIDGDRCYPTILETNRKIYHELVDQWYSTTSCCGKNTLRFANRSRLSTLDLPPGFRYLTKLSLAIRLEYHPSEREYLEFRALPRKAKQHLNLMNEVTDYFSTSGPGNNLQILEIEITSAPVYFKLMAYDEDWKESIRKGLRFHLHPLRKRRASKARVGLCLQLQVEPYQYVPHDVQPPTQEFRAGLFAICGAYFSLLEREISGATVEDP